MLVLGDLGDEVAGVQVVAHGHSKAQDQAVVVALHDLIQKYQLLEVPLQPNQNSQDGKNKD